ncbi:MAG: glycosyltransferase [Candidatus Omnitrophica bacterium]|nr:glycosyltransferase [Candidatus Omnitrophota bacterium]
MKFSIITVCLNAQNLIEKTVLSVLEQTYSDIEFIIIDGKSSDNTISILEKYKSQISQIISEPDKGIYDAMNKGINLSHGEFLYFLNAGDQLMSPNTLTEVAQFIKKHPTAELAYGDVKLQNSSDKWILNENTFSGEIRNLRYLYNNMFSQQRAFFKRTIFDKLGKFNTTYKIIADFDMAFRAYQSGLPFAYFNMTFVSIPLGGFSNIHLNQFFKERLRTLSNLPWWQKYWALDLFCGALYRGSFKKYFNIKSPGK